MPHDLFHSRSLQVCFPQFQIFLNFATTYATFFSSVFACRPVTGLRQIATTYRTHKLVLHSDSLLDLESNSREELLFMKAIKSSSVIRHPCPAFMPTNLPVVSH